MRIKTIILASAILVFVYFAPHFAAKRILEVQSDGPLAFLAQAYFAPEDLFSPVIDIQDPKPSAGGKVLRLEFSPKYRGPYRVGIGGVVANEEELIPEHLRATIECTIGSDKYQHKTETVSPFWGTPASGAGAVVGIINAEGAGRLVTCNLLIDEIEFIQDVTSIRVTVARMYVM